MKNSETVYLRSNLGVEECLRRIREAAGAPKFRSFSPSRYGGSKPVVAELRGSRVKLWKRKEQRNDFAPYFVGLFSSEGLGSRLSGRFRMDRALLLLLTFWLIFCVGISAATLPALLGHLTNSKLQGQLSGFDFMPLGLLVSGIFLFIYGRRIGKSEEPFLLDFIHTTLAARPENTRAQGAQGTFEKSPL
jgi:hypothetical protein